ncbi:MAG: universal stress protein, partial [Cyanobacteriota bacterium]|nr:universal stress protein [Cyanobacteriota bacterium]
MFKNLLIADSGKGQVGEMINMLRDLPAFKAARVNLLHVVTEQSKNESEEHWSEAGNLLSSSVQKLGLNPEEVNSIIRHG